MKLINADEAFRILSDYYHHRTAEQAYALIDALDRVPEAVVRCKDCKWYMAEDEMCGASGECPGPDDYCSYGERRPMRLIDAEDIPYTMLYKENWIKGTGKEAQGAWKSDIDKMTTIDAVPVVRCKDCRYNYANAEGREYNPNDIVCTYFDTDGMDASDFCSYGERRSDDDMR